MDQRSLNSHKNKGHSALFLPPIMRSSVGQCRNIRFRQLYTSHVIITSVYDNMSGIRKIGSVIAVTLITLSREEGISGIS